jgi:Spy/CpxP family protein refolding chaperone
MRWIPPAVALAPLFALAALTPARPAAARAEPVLWWNDPGLVQELSLSDAQRAKMDAAFERYKAVALAAPARAQVVADFEDALAAGDFAAARGKVEPMAQGAGDPMRAAANLKLEAFEALSPEQRKQLLTRIPRLLRQPWAPRPTWAGPAPRPQAAPTP